MQHRGERRGLGGIFFDDLNDYDQEMLLSFATGNSSRLRLIFGCIPPTNSNSSALRFFFNVSIYYHFAECANSVVHAYIPILEKRKDTPFNESHKAWQQLRRGRYVEFNLVLNRAITKLERLEILDFSKSDL